MQNVFLVIGWLVLVKVLDAECVPREIRKVLRLCGLFLLWYQIQNVILLRYETFCA